MRYVVLTSDSDAGEPAVICEDQDAVSKEVMRRLLDPGRDIAIPRAVIDQADLDLRVWDGDYVLQIQGDSAWKEWIYAAKLSEKPARVAAGNDDNTASDLMVRGQHSLAAAR